MHVLKEIYAYRQMIFSFVRRELRGRYKRSVLGFLWTFVNPLLQMVVYSIVFSTILQNGIEKYYLFLFVALIPWIFFSTSMTRGAKAVIAQAGMLKKIYFPREVLPIAYVTSNFVNMLYCFIVIFAVVLVSGTSVNFTALLYLPPVMITEYILALAVALMSSALTVYFRDLEHILGVVALAWQYLTPLFYKFERVPDKYQPIFALNPMMPVITAYRDILYNGRVPSMQLLGHSCAVGVVLLVAGFWLFGKLKRRFAEEL